MTPEVREELFYETSLELLKLLLAGVKHQHWLFIGAYRDNEVGPAHPLVDMFKTLEQFISHFLQE